MKVASDKFRNLTTRESRAYYGFKNGKSTMIRGSDKGSVVVVSDREDYNKEAEEQLGVKNVYEEVLNPPSPLF